MPHTMIADSTEHGNGEWQEEPKNRTENQMRREKKHTHTHRMKTNKSLYGSFARGYGHKSQILLLLHFYSVRHSQQKSSHRQMKGRLQ